MVFVKMLVFRKLLFWLLVTGPAVLVADTVRGFKEILDGKHDDVAEGNIYMKGGIEEIHA
jgi:F-type H+/Na+-transporting ATPase subunit beta